MNPHEWYVEHRLDFLVRALDPNEEESFSDHLRRCPECQAAIASLEREVGWLPMGAKPVRPRPGFRRQIVQRVLGERRPIWRRWIAPVALAATILVAVGVYVTQSRKAHQLQAALDGRTNELTALRDSLSIMHQAARVLQASISMDGHEGGMLIFADSVSHRWNVVVHGLPPAPVGETYQFWFICADGMVRGATVTSTSSGPVFLTLGMPKKGGAVMGGALTLESTSDRSPAPRGRTLAHLVL